MVDQQHKSLPVKKGSKFERVEPGLFRYKPSGVFYTVLKKDGKTKWRNLKTTDKPTARRLLSDDRNEQETLDSNLSGLEFGQLTDNYLASIAGKASKTIATRKGIIKSLRSVIPANRKVRDIKASEVLAWAGSLKMEERSYNEYIRVAKDIFKLATADRVIVKSPTDGLKRKKLQDIDRQTPTQAQFRAIVSEIRAQRFNAHAADTADFIEFMGLAGLGQAELRNLRLCDVKETKVIVETEKDGIKKNIESTVPCLEIRRQKTGHSFSIPIYPQVAALLQKLVEKTSLPAPETPEQKAAFPLRRLFRIDDGKKAFETACKRLGFPHFEQRGLRRMFITRAVEIGLDFKVIAATQGHSDGGVLVAKTYSHLRPEHFELMAAKLT